MTRAATALIVLLAAATYGAFFAARSLSRQPAALADVAVTPVFSPNGDGRLERASAAFTVRDPGRVAVAVVDEHGDRVRRLRTFTTRGRDARVRATWDGTAERSGSAAARARDGSYRFSVTLRDQGRAVVLPDAVRLDTTPPRPRVVAIGAAGPAPRPAILPLPGGGATPIAVDARGTDLRLRVFRTQPDAAFVTELDAPAAASARVQSRWDGTADGRPVGPGTYVVVAEVRDEAGNTGTSVPLDARGLPRAPYGQTLGGRGGVTVRYAGVEAPVEPVRAGGIAAFGVDTRQRPYRYELRRAGAPRADRAGRRPRGGPLRLRIPADTSGVELLTVRSGRHTAAVPVAVQAAGTRPVLVVLPLMTWQGRNPLDDDGDGAPNLLEHGDAVRLHRVLAGARPPATFAALTEPLLGWLDRTHRRYDVTTDVALARGRGPRLDGHSGVLLAGDARWLPPGVLGALRRFADRGGTIATVGTDNLRRQVELTRDDRLVAPTAPAPADALGLRPGPLLRSDALTLTNLRDDAGLFRGSSGELRGFTVAEPVRGVERGEVVSSAVTGDDETVVIAAVRTGRGLAIHLGLPELPTKLGARAGDPDAQALMERTWTLLSR